MFLLCIDYRRTKFYIVSYRVIFYFLFENNLQRGVLPNNEFITLNFSYVKPILLLRNKERY